jgi:hypothetical protein
VDVRLLTDDDAEEFVRLRLEALTRERDAFGRGPEDALPWPPESVASRRRAMPEGSFIVGAFDGRQTHMLDRARAYSGLEQVTLSVAVQQDAARRLYRARGFEVYGYEKRALKVAETYVDEEHMVLWLR